MRSAASAGSQCVGQSGAGHLAQLSVNVLWLHKSLCKLEPKQFCQISCQCPNTHDFTILPLLSTLDGTRLFLAEQLVIFLLKFEAPWYLFVALSDQILPSQPDVYCRSAGLDALTWPSNLYWVRNSFEVVTLLIYPINSNSWKCLSAIY